MRSIGTVGMVIGADGTAGITITAGAGGLGLSAGPSSQARLLQQRPILMAIIATRITGMRAMLTHITDTRVTATPGRTLGVRLGDGTALGDGSGAGDGTVVGTTPVGTGGIRRRSYTSEPRCETTECMSAATSGPIGFHRPALCLLT